MAKRPDSHESLLFLLELLRRIPRRGRITAETLRSQLHDAGIDQTLQCVLHHFH